MGQDSKIQWTHHTFNPWRGCAKVSPGCANCYAETLSKRNPAVLGVWGDKGTRVVASESQWREPLKWDKAAKAAGERHRVFCASLADVFEDWDGPVVTSKGLPFWWCHGSLSNSPIPSTGLDKGCHLATMDDIRERMFDLIDETPNLDWLLLTKRPENLDRMLPWTSAHAGEYRYRFWPNVWVGTTVENQEQADKRIPILKDIPAAVRFLSVEPMLGPIDLLKHVGTRWHRKIPGQHIFVSPAIHWVICGGESGAKARTFAIDWARDLRDQCREAGEPFFMKQMGANPVSLPKRTSLNPNILLGSGMVLHDSHGADPDEWPEDIRVREFPKVEVAAQ